MSCNSCRNNKIININIVNSLLNNKAFLTEAVSSGVSFSINQEAVYTSLEPKINACYLEMATEAAKKIVEYKKNDYYKERAFQNILSSIAEKYVKEIIQTNTLQDLFSKSIKENGSFNTSGTKEEQRAKANNLASDISETILPIINYINYVFGMYIPAAATQAADSAVRVTKLQKLHPTNNKAKKINTPAPSVELPSQGDSSTALQEIKISIRKNTLVSEESFLDKASPISTRHLKAYQFLQNWFKTNTPKTIITKQEQDDVYDAVRLVQKTNLHDRYGYQSVGEVDNTNGRIAPNVKQEKLAGIEAGKAIYWGSWELIHGPNKNIFEDLLKVSIEGQIEAVEKAHGREIAHFVLDIAGVIDPIGFFDSVNLALYAEDYIKTNDDEEKSRAFVGMITSAVGIAVPYVGDALLKPVKLLLETKKATEAFRIIKGFISRNSKTVLRVVEKITPRNFKPAIDDLKRFLREGELPKDQNWALQLEKRANEASLAAIEKELKSAIPTLSRMIQDNTLGLVLFQASQYVGLNKAIESLAERKVIQYVSEFIGSILKEGTEQAYYTIGTLLVIITNAENDPKVSAPNNNEINNLERKQKIYQIVREKIALSPSLSKEIKESFLTFVREIDDLIQRDIVNKKFNINENLKNKILINIVNKDLLNEGGTVKAWKELWTQAIEGFSRGFVRLEKTGIEQIIARASKLSVNGNLLEIKRLLKEITEEVDYSKFWSRFKTYRIYTKEAAKQFLGEAMLSNRRLIARLQDESNLIQAEINSYEKVTNSQLVMTQSEKNAANAALDKLRPAKENVDNQIKILEDQQVKLENKIKEVDQKGVPKETGAEGSASKPKGEGGVDNKRKWSDFTPSAIANWGIWYTIWYAIGNIICRLSAEIVAAWLIAKKTFMSPITSWFETIAGQIMMLAGVGSIALSAALSRLMKQGMSGVVRFISYKIAAGSGCATGARIKFGLAAAKILNDSGLTGNMDTISQRFAAQTDATQEEIEEALYGDFKEGNWWAVVQDTLPIPSLYGDYGKIGTTILRKTDITNTYTQATDAVRLGMGLTDPKENKEIKDFAARELKDKFFVSFTTASQLLLIRKYLKSRNIEDPELQTAFLSCLIQQIMLNLSDKLKDVDYKTMLQSVSNVFDFNQDIIGISEEAKYDKTALTNAIKSELLKINQKIGDYISEKKINVPGFPDFGGGKGSGGFNRFLNTAKEYIDKLSTKDYDTEKGKQQLTDAFNETQKNLNERIKYYEQTYPQTTEEQKRYRANNIKYYTDLRNKNKEIYDKIMSNQIKDSAAMNIESEGVTKIKYNCETIKKDYADVWKEAVRIVDITKGSEIEVGDIVTHIATGRKMAVASVNKQLGTIKVTTSDKEWNKYLFMIFQKKAK